MSRSDHPDLVPEDRKGQSDDRKSETDRRKSDTDGPDLPRGTKTLPQESRFKTRGLSAKG